MGADSKHPGRWLWGGAYSSGLFCVSMMAARGIPKFETGPQKSVT